MQIAIVLYDRFTALDAVGPYQVLSSLRGAEVVFAAEQAGLVSDDERSLHLSADAALSDVPHPDIVVVPGGPGQNDQMDDGPRSRPMTRARRTAPRRRSSAPCAPAAASSSPAAPPEPTSRRSGFDGASGQPQSNMPSAITPGG